MSRYYMPAPKEGALNGLYNWLFKGKRPRPKFPRAILAQTISRCNAKCVFCCHSTEPEAIQHGRMQDGLINKIIDEMGQNKFWFGRFSPFLINEPLMDTRMPEILARARKVCGRAAQDRDHHQRGPAHRRRGRKAYQGEAQPALDKRERLHQRDLRSHHGY